jgi:signal peptidase I
MPDESPSSGFWHGLRIVAIGRRPKRTLARLAVLVVASVVVFNFVLLPIRVTGSSMEPTYHDRAVNFINRLAYVLGQPRRGDVVGIRLSPNANATFHELLLKRLVGLPGETISFSDGHVCVNGAPQDEPYLKLSSGWNVPGKTLGPDDYYFVGDNRSMRPDEHVHGVAPRSQIVGRILLGGNPPAAPARKPAQ